jgi:hypothetical protein
MFESLLDEASKHGEDEKMLGYVGTNAEPVCVDFCNFVRYQIFVNYLE